MGKSQRTKGHNFERQIATQFRNAGWLFAARHLEFQAIEAAQGYDLVGTEPFKIQCKAHQNYVPISNITQIKAKSGDIPVLISKGDNERACAVVYFDDFLRIIAAARRAGIHLKPPTVDDF